MSKQNESAGPVESVSCDFGIVVSEAAETGSITDKLSGVVKTQGHGFKVVEGGSNGRRIVVFEAGEAGAATATRSLIQGHQPRWVMAAGFATGLVPNLRRGDLIVGNGVADMSGRRLAIDFKQPPVSGGLEFQVGRVVTLDRRPRNPEEKQQLAGQKNAIVADMNSMSVADVCREQNVLCLVVRVVLEQLDDRISEEVQNLVEQKSIAGKLGATVAMAKRPASVKDWLSSKQESLSSADRLASFLIEMIQQLAPTAKGPEGKPC
ncbi:MAG: hypothetical protein N2C12_01910 [Planctomycetales bacterium]